MAKQTSAQREYQKYLQTAKWDNVRNIVICRDLMCRDCTATYRDAAGFEIHHVRYTNWMKGSYDEARDCVLLCHNCHDKRHAKVTPMWQIESDLHRWLYEC